MRENPIDESLKKPFIFPTESNSHVKKLLNSLQEKNRGLTLDFSLVFSKYDDEYRTYLKRRAWWETFKQICFPKRLSISLFGSITVMGITAFALIGAGIASAGMTVAAIGAIFLAFSPVILFNYVMFCTSTTWDEALRNNEYSLDKAFTLNKIQQLSDLIKHSKQLDQINLTSFKIQHDPQLQSECLKILATAKKYNPSVNIVLDSSMRKNGGSDAKISKYLDIINSKETLANEWNPTGEERFTRDKIKNKLKKRLEELKNDWCFPWNQKAKDNEIAALTTLKDNVKGKNLLEKNISTVVSDWKKDKKKTGLTHGFFGLKNNFGNFAKELNAIAPKSMHKKRF